MRSLAVDMTGASRMKQFDAALTKAIRFVVILSVLVHSFLLIKQSSRYTEGWLDTIAMIQSLDDVPAILTSKNYSNVALSTTTSQASLSGELHKILEGQDPIDLRPPSKVNRIPLVELIESNNDPKCVPGKSQKRLINSTVLPDSQVYSAQRQIPKIVHVTAKSRCMTPYFIKNIDLWRFPGYALYVHDDVAVDRLLNKYWPEFPQLQLFLKCTKSGAAKADLWRLLVLWEYGGIYTDIDNAPGPKFANASVIKDDDEAYFVVEKIGVMSQYFMAATPKHPFLHIAITHTFERLLEVSDIGDQYVPFVTGPGAIKTAMMKFLKDDTKEKVGAGTYTGVDGWTIRVDGNRVNTNKWVQRESVSGIHKKGGYAAMGMKHFGSDKGSSHLSCVEHLSNEYQKLIKGKWTGG